MLEGGRVGEGFEDYSREWSQLVEVGRSRACEIGALDGVLDDRESHGEVGTAAGKSGIRKREQPIQARVVELNRLIYCHDVHC